MSEIRDRARAHIHSVLLEHRFVCTASFGYEVAEKILSIKELAIVDRDAELPVMPIFSYGTRSDYGKLIQNRMRESGWVREIKDG